MRRGFNGCIFKREDGVPFAINLGADYCAEHEWGIAGIRWMLGCPDDVDGLKRYSSTRKETELLPYLGTRTIKGIFYLVLSTYTPYFHTEDGKFDPRTRRELTISDEQKWSAAWCENEFGIAVDKKSDSDVFAFVKTIQKHIEKGDIACWFGGVEARNPFSRAGLVIGIPSLTPKEIDEAMVKAHDDERALKAADGATGIQTLLKKKMGNVFHNCSPRWVDRDRDKSCTKHPVIYWLNSIGPYGWYTVEELTDWANGVSGNVIDTRYEKIVAERNKRVETAN